MNNTPLGASMEMLDHSKDWSVDSCGGRWGVVEKRGGTKMRSFMGSVSRFGRGTACPKGGIQPVSTAPGLTITPPQSAHRLGLSVSS